MLVMMALDSARHFLALRILFRGWTQPPAPGAVRPLRPYLVEGFHSLLTLIVTNRPKSAFAGNAELFKVVPSLFTDPLNLDLRQG